MFTFIVIVIIIIFSFVFHFAGVAGCIIPTLIAVVTT